VIVGVGVDDAMIAEWIENREFLRTDTNIETDARSLAAQIGLVSLNPLRILLSSLIVRTLPSSKTQKRTIADYKISRE